MTQQEKKPSGLIRVVTVAGTLLIGGFLWTNVFFHVRNVEATITYPSFEVAPEPIAMVGAPDQVVRGVVRGGQSLYSVLGRYGLAKSDVLELLKTARRYKDLSRMSNGASYRIKLDASGRLNTFEIDLSPTRQLLVERTPFGFVASAGNIRYETRLARITGTAKRSLVSDLMAREGGAKLAQEMLDIFAWQIDFARDIRPGDSFRILAEETWRDGEFERFGKILMAQIQTHGRSAEALLYGNDYYDPSGHPLKQALLPAPVDYTRISSRFSRARMHPIYGYIRPHYGVDFAAAYGAPVRATGDGEVVFVGWKGDNGRLVTVRHKGAYRTSYAHLSKFAPNIRRGTTVRQGQVVGYVGNSGASTGTHMHYAVYRNGRPLDPLDMDVVPVGEPIDVAKNADFQLAWDQALLKLTQLEETRLASNSPR